MNVDSTARGYHYLGPEHHNNSWSVLYWIVVLCEDALIAVRQIVRNRDYDFRFLLLAKAFVHVLHEQHGVFEAPLKFCQHDPDGLGSLLSVFLRPS
jgi:hypothetical protein